MIKDKLMVGNWVMFADEYTQVTDVMCDCLNTSFWERMPYDVFEPIPLSPDILEKCGFEKEYESQWTKRYTHIEDARIGYDWSINGGWCARWVGEKYSHINNVHQLQNFVYALTGTELTITL